MNRAWKDRMSKDPNYAAKRAHAKDAYVSGCWIFCSENDTWYSPEEFMASNESASFYRGKEDLNKFKIIHPSVGLARKRDLIRLLEQEANDMERRIKKYQEIRTRSAEPGVGLSALGSYSFLSWCNLLTKLKRPLVYNVLS